MDRSAASLLKKSNDGMDTFAAWMPADYQGSCCSGIQRKWEENPGVGRCRTGWMDAVIGDAKSIGRPGGVGPDGNRQKSMEERVKHN